MRTELQTCKELIDPALKAAGWSWNRELVIGPGQVNISGSTMYDESQRIIADYLLRFHNMPLAILEAKAELEDASNGMQQGARYARRLGLRFSIATNGHQYIVVDNETGKFDCLNDPPTPIDILKMMGRSASWDSWRPAFEIPWHVDQVTQKRVRPYQEMAIFESLYRFSQNQKRVLLLMATGTGKTFTVFQLIWKLMQGNVLQKNRILFLTDRNNLQDQAYRAFSAFPAAQRVVINKEVVSQGAHRVGNIFFANYQNLFEDLDGRRLYEHFEPDFFDLVVVDECHRSGFGDWFAILEYFGSAFQLGLTATPRELQDVSRPLTGDEARRDTYTYFTGSRDGEPAYSYTLKQAIEDGYLVPYLLEERLSNVDKGGYVAEDGATYGTNNFERDIRMPDRTRFIAEDLWAQLGLHGLRDEKAIIFCVDDTHAAFMAQELRRLAADDQFAARITRSERNSRQLEKYFAEVGSGKPRIATTVDLLSTGFDAPDVKVVVFARPLKSSILYKQMKGRGTRLCQDIDKRFFYIFDYVGASSLEDSEFDGHPANQQQIRMIRKTPKPRKDDTQQKPIGHGVNVFLSSSEKYVCLADGRKIPFDDYCDQSRQVIQSISTSKIENLLDLWVDRKTRQDLRAELKDRDIHLAALRHYLELEGTDDVDILAKIGFELPRVPMRHDRVTRFWADDEQWLFDLLGETHRSLKVDFWETSLDHYALYGIDDLEQGRTYSAPQFAERFGSFAQILDTYGGPQVMRQDLEEVKRHIYVPMAA
ncbi:DEAD/DEAH box helicase family protein [Candidatus Obscuribacterales bacterium]|nr:DEAD/DEAH box helicase family protein [Candidatus Obscuribacterales bacterium]